MFIWMQSNIHAQANIGLSKGMALPLRLNCAITWTNVDMLSTEPSWINRVEIWIQTQWSSLTKMQLSMSLTKYLPFCSVLNVLMRLLQAYSRELWSHDYISTIDMGNPCLSDIIKKFLLRLDQDVLLDVPHKSRKAVFWLSANLIKQQGYLCHSLHQNWDNFLSVFSKLSVLYP